MLHCTSLKSNIVVVIHYIYSVAHLNVVNYKFHYFIIDALKITY